MLSAIVAVVILTLLVLLILEVLLLVDDVELLEPETVLV